MSDGLYGSPVYVRESEPGDEDRTRYHLFRDLDQAALYIAREEDADYDIVHEELEDTWVFNGDDRQWVIGQPPPDVENHMKEL